MESLSEGEFRKRAEQAFVSVFVESNPYGEPFRSVIKPRLLLYGFRWHLHEPWLKPIVSAIEALGEDGFYVSALARPKSIRQSQFYHWFVPLGEADIYGSKVFSQQNAVYSIHGQWGIICSDEDHALVGGSGLLITNIRDSVPDLDDRLKEFLNVWKYYHETNKVDIRWIPRVLIHVYGAEKAREILHQAQLERLLFDKT